VSTGGGSVDLSDVGGRRRLKTGGGSIRLTSAKDMCTRRRAVVALNFMECLGTGRNGCGRDHRKLVNTEASVTIPIWKQGRRHHGIYCRDVAIDVRASVDMGNGHHITSDFPDIHIGSEGDKWGPKTLTAEAS